MSTRLSGPLTLCGRLRTFWIKCLCFNALSRIVTHNQPCSTWKNVHYLIGNWFPVCFLLQVQHLVHSICQVGWCDFCCCFVLSMYWNALWSVRWPFWKNMLLFTPKRSLASPYGRNPLWVSNKWRLIVSTPRGCRWYLLYPNEIVSSEITPFPPDLAEFWPLPLVICDELMLRSIQPEHMHQRWRSKHFLSCHL